MVGTQGNDGYIYYGSPPYTSLTETVVSGNKLYLAKWTNDKFTILGQNSSNIAVLLTTTDGITVTLRKTFAGTGNQNGSGSIVYGNGHYLTCSANLDSPNVYNYSSNGTSYSGISASNSLSGFNDGSTQSARCAVYNPNNQTFYIYNNTRVAYTTNPSSNSGWTVETLGGVGFNGRTAVWAEVSGGVVCVALSGGTPFIAYSNNGTSFSSSTTPFASPAQNGVSVLIGIT
jgi:hypothetical protein